MFISITVGLQLKRQEMVYLREYHLKTAVISGVLQLKSLKILFFLKIFFIAITESTSFVWSI